MKKRNPLRWQLIAGLAIAVFVAVFTIINSNPTEIDLIFIKKPIPLALLVILMILLGAILGVISSMPSNYRLKREIRNLKSQISDLEKKNKALLSGPEEEPKPISLISPIK